MCIQSNVCYEWDPIKAETNLQKHGVDFADAVLALEDGLCLMIDEQSYGSEIRHVAMGSDPLGRVLAIVFTYRGEKIRVISARVATKRERRFYEEGE